MCEAQSALRKLNFRTKHLIVLSPPLLPSRDPYTLLVKRVSLHYDSCLQFELEPQIPGNAHIL